MSYLVDIYQLLKVVIIMIDRACISINAICNLDCPYCHFGHKKNNANSMEYEFTNDDIYIFYKNLELYILSNNIKQFKLGVVGSGEPMLSFNIIKDLVELVANGNCSKIINIYTITNGTIMEDYHLDFFYTYKEIIEVNFSLDGFKQLHNIYRSNYDITYINILKYEKKFGVKPKINTVVTRNTLVFEDQLFNFYITNGFSRINFSIVFGIKDNHITISQDDYDLFIDRAQKRGIISRQSNQNIRKYDCTKYGKLCGVGRTNIFITKKGIYPCSRFLGLDRYIIGNINLGFDDIERNLDNFISVRDGQCYYEYHNIGN